MKRDVGRRHVGVSFRQRFSPFTRLTTADYCGHLFQFNTESISNNKVAFYSEPANRKKTNSLAARRITSPDFITFECAISPYRSAEVEAKSTANH